MTMGLRADIYESKAIGNCSGGGISSRAKSVTIVKVFGEEPGGPWEPNDDAPAVVVEHGPAGSIRAVPAIQNEPGEWSPVRPSNRVGPMMGGTYIGGDGSLKALVGDFRPIALHDRYETPAEYEALST
jgi:hypothetical protein